MIKHKKVLSILGCTILLSGCASYQATSLGMLPEEPIKSCEATFSHKVAVSSKRFNKEESELYLGRDVLSEGYIPMQVTIRNNTSDPIHFNPSNINVPLVSATEVANKVHTSTAGRVIGYGIPGLLFMPLLVPAVYDGIRSSEANDALDADYAEKAMKEQTIQAHNSLNGVFFIPKAYKDQPIELFLVNQKSQEKMTYTLVPRE